MHVTAWFREGPAGAFNSIDIDIKLGNSHHDTELTTLGTQFFGTRSALHLPTHQEQGLGGGFVDYIWCRGCTVIAPPSSCARALRSA